ncbi:MAG: hypothetical protein ACI85K_001560 [Hyphomicrobiaceae bacterium]|jgi:hypothetical protein
MSTFMTRSFTAMSLAVPLAMTLTCFALSSCATDMPISTSFDSSAGLASCEILGDGFVLTGGRRIPLEAFVLELRQATRAMTSDELSRYVVAIGFNPNVEAGIAAKNISDGREYLLRQLEIMGVRQART